MDHQDLIIKKTNYGKGVFAVKDIKKGTLIAQCDGPIYTAHYRHWTRDLSNHVVQFARRRWRDSLGLFRLVNHSCEPNCGIKKLFNLVAMRNISAGEEITWDYEMTEDNQYGWQMKCKCGTQSCRKIIGAYRNMPAEVRKKYKGFISSWITDQKSVARKREDQKRR